MQRVHVALLTAILIQAVPGLAQDAPELYDIEFKEKESYMEVVQDRYVWFKVKNGFTMYDARSGKTMWSHKELPEFDGEFTLLWDESYLLYSTKKGVARLDVVSGELDYSVELSEFKFKDVDRFWSTDSGILLQIKNNLAMLDPATGQAPWFTPIQPNSDFANKGKPWIWDLGDRLLVLSKQGPVLLSLETGDVLWSVEDKLNKKIDEGAVTLIGDRAIIYFEKSLRILDLDHARELAMVEGKIEESTSFEVFEFGGKTYLFFGYNQKLMAFDGDTGDKLWESAEGQVEGSVRWVRESTQPGKVLLIDVRVDKFGGDAGTWLTMHSIDLATGQIGWSQLIGYSQMAAVFINKIFSQDSSARSGMDIPVWFEEPLIDGDDLVFLIKGLVLGDPLTKERNDSQGLLSIDVASGRVNYLTKFRVLPQQAGKGYMELAVMARLDPLDAYPAPQIIGDLVVAATEDGLIGVDRSSGGIRWQLEKSGLVTDMTRMADGSLLAKLGGTDVNVTLQQDKMAYSGKSVGPHGFMRLDPASGQVAWTNIDFEVDPTQAMAFAIDGDALFGCDGDRFYSLSLSSGQIQWTFDIKKQGKAGKIYGDKAWTMDMEKSVDYGITSTTTTTTWSNPRRILRAEYRGTHFIAFGEKAIIRVNRDGRMAWRTEWKYANTPNSVQLDPTFVGERGDIVFAVNGFHGIDGETGQLRWSDKDVVGDFRLLGEDLLIVRYKKKLRGFSLN